MAFGPFLMVTRQAYDASGGHAAAPDHVVDDVEMSRNVKRAGFRVRVASGTDLVETRWYDDLGDIWMGFSKNWALRTYGNRKRSPSPGGREEELRLPGPWRLSLNICYWTSLLLV